MILKFPDQLLGAIPQKFWLVAALALALFIIIMGLQPGSRISLPTLFPHDDKLKHFLVFMLLAALLFRWRYPINIEKRPVGRMPWLPALAVPFLVGLTDETFQSFVAGRMSDVWDLFADTMGGCSAVLLGLWQRQRAILHLRETRKRQRRRTSLRLSSLPFTQKTPASKAKSPRVA